jgi:hypothetical protein
MPDTNENSNFSRSGPCDSLNCKPLLDSSTPELFLTNAFRITGLGVDATAREIIKHSDKLKIMEELGQGKTLHTGAFALKTPPSVDQIREAVQRLKDPEKRIVDEFFWFWPKQSGKGAADPALKALEGGDANEALERWTATETIPNEGLVSMHNLAVLWLLKALEQEDQYAKTEFTTESRKETDRLWRNAFKRWNLLAVDDLFWKSLTARIERLDEARLPSDFSQRMRSTLPCALGKINGELALRYAENGRMDLAQAQVRFMREACLDQVNINQIAGLILRPTIARLKQQIQIAQEQANRPPADLIPAVLGLIVHAKRYLPLLGVILGQESDVGNELSDEVASVCNRLQLEYHKATGDDQSCLETLRNILPFAKSTELRNLVEGNISVTQTNVALAPIREVCANAAMTVDSDPAAGEREGQRILLEAKALLTDLSYSGISLDITNQAKDEIAVSVMNCAVQFGNKTEKWDHCIPLLESSLQLAVCSDLQKRLIKNLETVRANHAIYGNLSPIKSAPSLGTIGPGIGLTLLGCSDKDNASGSYLTTYYFIFFFIPIFPICRYRVALVEAGRATRYRFFGEAPLRTFDKWHLAISICVIIWLAINHSANSPNQGSPTPPTPSGSNVAPSRDTGSLPLPTTSADKEKTVYRVPSYIRSELERDSQVIDSEKAKMAAIERRLNEAKQIVDNERAKTEGFEIQLNTLKTQIEAAQKFIDRSSQSSVDEFNRKVNRYNAALATLRTQNDKMNQAVDLYNSTLDEARHQNILLNKRVDEYNEKLRRSGR